MGLDEALIDGWKLKVLKLSDDGKALFKDIEVLKLKPYDDQTGKDISAYVEGATIGYGYLIPQDEWNTYKDGITEDKADELFSNKLKTYEDCVNDYVEVEVSQSQYDALVLLCYNIGVGDFKSSSVLNIVNGNPSEEYGSDIKAAWLAWVYSQGIENDGLKNRRNCELNIYNQGVYKKW